MAHLLRCDSQNNVSSTLESNRIWTLGDPEMRGFLHFLGVMEMLIGCPASFCYVLPLTIGGAAPVR